jgi:hypothetical protein
MKISMKEEQGMTPPASPYEPEMYAYLNHPELWRDLNVSVHHRKMVYSASADRVSDGQHIAAWYYDDPREAVVMLNYHEQKEFDHAYL